MVAVILSPVNAGFLSGHIWEFLLGGLGDIFMSMALNTNQIETFFSTTVCHMWESLTCRSFHFQNEQGLLSIEILRASLDNAGRYICEASNSEGKAACSAYLDVDGKLIELLQNRVGNSANIAFERIKMWILEPYQIL